MSVIAEFTIGSEQFPLGSVLSVDPEMEIEIDRVVPTTAAGVPYLWATGENFETFEAQIRENPLIDDITAIDRVENSVLYRIDWNEGAETLMKEIARSNVTILEAYRDGDWFFRLRFERHEDLSAFHEYCSEHTMQYRLDRIYSDASTSNDDFEFGLTVEQRDALVLAVERGYFRVPRGVTLSDLGDELAISQQAASERIRRATDKVLRTVFPATE